MKNISKQEEIEILNQLFDSDSYFAECFGNQREQIIQAIKDDFSFLAHCNLSVLGLSSLKQIQEKDYKIKELEEKLHDSQVMSMKFEKDLYRTCDELSAYKRDYEMLELEHKMLKRAYDMELLKKRIAADENYQLTEQDRELIMNVTC